MQSFKHLRSFEKSVRRRREGNLFVLSFLFLFMSSLVLIALMHGVSLQKYYVLRNDIPEEGIEVKKDDFYLPPITTLKAKSFVVYDIVHDKVLISKNSKEVLPLASLTKIKTAHLFASEHNLDDKIIIPNLGKKHVYDYTLKPGDTWTGHELLRLMLTISSNDAADIFAMTHDKSGKDGFIALMNEGSASSTLFFTSPSGLDVGENIGGRGSAIHMAYLVRDFYKAFPSLFESTAKKKIAITVNNKKYTGVPNTNDEVESYRGIIGSKTGYTDKAGGNLAIIYDVGLGEPLVIVLLGSTREGRFTDMKSIIAYINNYYEHLSEGGK